MSASYQIEDIKGILGTRMSNTAKIAAIKAIVYDDSSHGDRGQNGSSKKRQNSSSKKRQNGGSSRRHHNPHTGSGYISAESTSQQKTEPQIVEEIHKIFGDKTEMHGSEIGNNLRKAGINLPAGKKLGRFLTANGFGEKGEKGNKTYIRPQTSVEAESPTVDEAESSEDGW